MPLFVLSTNKEFVISAQAQVSTYPDATNTGYTPTGVTLTPYTGPTTITTAGTVIDSKDINSCLLINANNVTIKRSYIHASCFYLIDNYASESGGGTGLLIEDTDLQCTTFVKGMTAISDRNFIARRVNITGCENGIYITTNVTLEDSFVHNLTCYNPSTDPHIDGVQFTADGNNLTIQHNRIYGTCDRNQAGDDGNSAIFVNSPSTNSNVLVTNNILAGGGWTLYCNQGRAATNSSYTNNRFSNVFHATVGSIGLTDQCGDEVFTGNICNESGQAVTASTMSCSGTATPPPGPTPTPTPTPTPSPTPPGTLTMGETTILPNTDSGNGNEMHATQTSLSTSGTLQSLSFYVVTATGQLRLGVYDSTGPSGGPGAKIAETAAFTPVTGWNTQAVVTPVALTAGTYWLAYLPSSSSLSFKEQPVGNTKTYAYTFGPLPATFSTTPTSCTCHWSLYANLSSGSATPVVGDINNDHIVNSIDYSILNSHWFTNDANSDLNHDGLVNAIDYSILNANWFKTW